MTEAPKDMEPCAPLAYLDYRCPTCHGQRCGNDANAGWDVVTQQSVLLSEFDKQWCNDCGDVTLEEFTVTDPAEIARIDAQRALLQVRDLAEPLLDAVRSASEILTVPGNLTVANLGALRVRLERTVALAEGMRTGPTEAMLVLTTLHLQHDTCTEWLDTAPFAAFTKADYGWFVYVPEDLDAVAMPDDLRACCERARACGCPWLMFDRDAPALPELPTFVW
ncbi:DUF5983 family protein [Novosphingobium terrae]|uniref:DUF5983 family protein n=1 Tax=Novosphingobium terrae TaxID=2726189 RepID=UPI00198171D4|nr:hypothetical protein [Novosphingobium terrae]